MDLRRNLAAILSADAKGYSRLMGDDDEATVRTITAYRQVMVCLIRDYRGRVVDSPGDNLLAEFTSVVDAVHCATKIQTAFATNNSEMACIKFLDPHSPIPYTQFPKRPDAFPVHYSGQHKTTQRPRTGTMARCLPVNSGEYLCVKPYLTAS
jgi:hypothetical protein